MQLKLKNLTVAYGENIALEDLNLNIEVGSLMALVGPNGAGKSTLIKLLAGELTALSGTVQLANGVQLGYFAQHQLILYVQMSLPCGICRSSHQSKQSNRYGITSGVLHSMVTKLIKR